MRGTLAEPTAGTVSVTLLTEGTYPHSHGGVSVWCDQLVRGMPDIDFEVIAVTGTGRGTVAWELPAERHGVTAVPLWGPPPAVRARTRAGGRGDVPGRGLRAASCSPCSTRPRSTPSRRSLYRRRPEHARRGTLSAALAARSPRSAPWRRCGPGRSCPPPPPGPPCTTR